MKKKIAIGVYFAQDYIIHTAYDVFSNKFERVYRDIESPQDGQQNIRLAAEAIHRLYSKYDIVGIGLAVPTTIPVLDRTDKENYGRIGFPIGPRQWHEINVVKSIKHELATFGTVISESAHVAIISQVGATAFGDYRIRFPEVYSNGFNHKIARTIGNVLYVVADYGIGGALIHRGKLFHGSSVPNIGHSIVHLHEDEIPKRCSLHPKRPCLNAVASLDAIEKRWGMTPSEFVRCKDEKKVSLVASYIAQILGNLLYFCSPDNVVIAGRVSTNPMFLPLLHANLLNQLNIKAVDPQIENNALVSRENFILRPVDINVGVKGACLLAEAWFRQEINKVES